MSGYGSNRYSSTPFDHRKFGSHERYLERNEQSKIHKMKETYWTTKQVVIKKLNKKEDPHVVASDHELDVKLEVFKAVQTSCMDLLRCLEKYQDQLCALSQEENAAGRFLKNESALDKTRAGKIMAAVGKSLSFSSQQRLALRVPLVRLYQEVETFRYRAITDTVITVNKMEASRTEYRGALMWMKAASEELDPDMLKQMDKFRKVQAQVKKTKTRFDKLKLDSMQKIDLLAASRINMFSHVLATYQTTLLHFWCKTSHTMNAVAESFKGYQYYEFNMLKELCEPSKQLAKKTNGLDSIEDKEGSEDDSDPINNEKEVEVFQNENDSDTDTDDPLSRLISFEEEQGTDVVKELIEKGKIDSDSLKNFFAGDVDTKSDQYNIDQTDLILIDWGEPNNESDPGLSSTDPFLDFEDNQTIEEIKKKQDAEFDFSGQIIKDMEDKKNINSILISKDNKLDILSGLSDNSDNNMSLIDEILGVHTPDGTDEFATEWQNVFGAGNPLTYSPETNASIDNASSWLPSNLLDFTSNMNNLNLSTSSTLPNNNQSALRPINSSSNTHLHSLSQNTENKPGKKVAKSDMSAWFDLFAELDPLANPDAIGKSSSQMDGAL